MNRFPMDSRHLDEERLANAVSEYVDLLNAGAAPALEQYLQKHADLAHELRPLLKTASSLADAGAALAPRSPLRSPLLPPPRACR